MCSNHLLKVWAQRLVYVWKIRDLQYPTCLITAFLWLYTPAFCRMNYALLGSQPGSGLQRCLVCVQTGSKTPAQPTSMCVWRAGISPSCVQGLLLCGACNILLALSVKTGTWTFALVLLKLPFSCSPKSCSLYRLNYFSFHFFNLC